MKSNKNDWDSSKLLKVDSKGSFIDLNTLALKSYYVKKGHKIPLGVFRDYYDENIASYDEDLNKNTVLFAEFINGVPVNSRNTTARGICKVSAKPSTL